MIKRHTQQTLCGASAERIQDSVHCWLHLRTAGGVGGLDDRVEAAARTRRAGDQARRGDRQTRGQARGAVSERLPGGRVGGVDLKAADGRANCAALVAGVGHRDGVAAGGDPLPGEQRCEVAHACERLARLAGALSLRPPLGAGRGHRARARRPAPTHTRGCGPRPAADQGRDRLAVRSVRRERGAHVTRGYDKVKDVNGHKHHIALDTLGPLTRAPVLAADARDRDGGQRPRELAVHQANPRCRRQPGSGWSSPDPDPGLACLASVDFDEGEVPAVAGGGGVVDRHGGAGGGRRGGNVLHPVGVAAGVGGLG